MGNKMIDKAVNPFIQIAGARALAWGALGIAGFYCDMLLCRLSLSWVASFRSGAQSCVVVLCSRASDCVAVVPYVDKSFLWIK